MDDHNFSQSYSIDGHLLPQGIPPAHRLMNHDYSVGHPHSLITDRYMRELRPCTIRNDSFSLPSTFSPFSNPTIPSHTRYLPSSSPPQFGPTLSSSPAGQSNDHDNEDHLPAIGSSNQQSTTKKSLYNRNPKGNNQYRDCVRKDDDNLRKLLIEYDDAGIVNKYKISELLERDHGMAISPAGVTRRRKDLGLNNALRGKQNLSCLPSQRERKSMQQPKREKPSADDLSEAEKRLHLLDALVNRFFYHPIPGELRREIRFSTDLRLPIKWIRDELSSGWLIGHYAGAFHERWRIVYEETKLGGILGISDWGSIFWLGIWVLPSTSVRFVLYCILTLVRSFRGVPGYLHVESSDPYEELSGFIQTTDHSRAQYDSLSNDLVHSFRDYFNKALCNGRLPGLCLNKVFDMVIQEVTNQELKCDEDIAEGIMLRKWAWSRWTQSKMDALRSKFNAIPSKGWDRLEKKTIFLPRQKWLMEYEKYGYESCLQAVDPTRVEQIMEDLGGEELIQFAPPEFRAKAEPIYEEILREHKPETLQELYDLMVPRMRELEAGLAEGI